MNEVKESTFFKDLKNRFIQAISSPLSLCLSSHLDYLHMKQSLACSQIISLIWSKRYCRHHYRQFDCGSHHPSTCVW